MPDFKYENDYDGNVIGLDEAGCGPWAGPVVAGAALIFFKTFPISMLEQINDSKKLSSSKRQKIMDNLKIYEGVSCFTAVGISTVEEIEVFNIRQAALKAMQRATENLCLKLPATHYPSLALVDGIAIPQLPFKVKTLIRGDSLSFSIALASIVAKVNRDLIMLELSQKHPEYGWEKNAGYGTPYHQKAIEKHGITPHHRRKYAPIAKYLI